MATLADVAALPSTVVALAYDDVFRITGPALALYARASDSDLLAAVVASHNSRVAFLAGPAPDPPPAPPTPQEVAAQMADTIHQAVTAVGDTATVPELRDAIAAALAPYLPAVSP